MIIDFTSRINIVSEIWYHCHSIQINIFTEVKYPQEEKRNQNPLNVYYGTTESIMKHISLDE